MEKRVLIAAVLSILILLAYQQVMVRWISPPETVLKKEAEPRQPLQKQEITSSNAASSSDAAGDTSGINISLQPQEYKEKTVTVETPLYRAVFTSIGGGLKGFELKKYKEGLADSSKNIEIVKSLNAPLYPLQTGFSNTDALQFILPEKAVLLNASGQTKGIVLSSESQDGIRIEKKFVFSADTYNIKAEVSILNKSGKDLTSPLSTDLFSHAGSVKEDEASYHHGPIAHVNGNVERKTIKDKQEIAKGKIGWAAIEDKYFIMAVIPEDKESLVWSSLIVHQDIVRSRLDMPLNLSSNSKAVKKYTIYIGPKEYSILKNIGANLEEAIDFGWFAFFARPLLLLLNFFYVYIHNYGLAIILLTVLIKIVFHPLTRQGLNSMKEMQRMQPQMLAIREKYKNDKEKMSKELMEFYKRNKVNPLGGCLPMVMQIPVFIALYNVLSASIEMRHAPFMLWIQDMSAKDPYLVTPILMGATMLWQQKMTPSAMDPQQAKIMLVMPVIFTFMFLSFPSGLVLYWLVNNVISIAQQYYIQKTVK